jgi:hypothetical protein
MKVLKHTLTFTGKSDDTHALENVLAVINCHHPLMTARPTKAGWPVRLL